MSRMPSAAAKDRPAPGRPRALAHDDIVAGAIDLIAKRGYEALSMRTLARQLRTGAATLYNYFPSQGVLEEAIVDRMLATVKPLDPQARKPLREQLVDMACAYRDLILQHPEFDAIVSRSREGSALRLLNSNLRCLVGAGVPIERAGLCNALLNSIAHNHAMAARHARVADPAARRKRWARELEPKDFEMVSAYLESSLFKGGPEATFRRSILMTIDRLMPELLER